MHTLPGQLTGAPFQVDAYHVVHAERAHGKTELLQHRIHLVRQRAFEQQLARFGHITAQHAVTDETRAVAGHYRHFAQAFAQRQGGIEHRLVGVHAAHYLEQLHDMRGAEEMQAQHPRRSLGHRRDRVDVQRRGIAGQDRLRFEVLIQGSEDFLLEFKAFIHRLDHQIGLGQRGVAIHRLHARQAGFGLGLGDTLLFHLLGPGLADHAQASVQG